MNLQPGDMLVARLWRWDSERLAKDAEDQRFFETQNGESDEFFSISAWGMEMEPGESLGDLKARLADYVRGQRSARWVVFVPATRLSDANFELRPSGVEHHYDVLIGPALDPIRLSDLAAVFNSEERERF